MPVCATCGKTHPGKCLQNTRSCYLCGEPGHIKRHYPRNVHGGREQEWVQRTEPYRGARPQVNNPILRKKREASEEREKSVPARVFALSSQEAKESSEVVTGMITILDFPVRVLFDSGASHSFISESISVKLHLEPVDFTPGVSIMLPDGSCMFASTSCLVDIVIAGRTFRSDLIFITLV